MTVKNLQAGGGPQPSVMKAIVYEQFGGTEVLNLSEVPIPALRSGDLLIKVHSSAVNYVDIRERQGTYNKPETQVGGIKLPHIPGLQAVGVVVAAEGTSDIGWIGKTVLAYLPHGGGYAEYVAASSVFCVELPEHADPTTYATLPTQGLTAYLLLKVAARLTEGESILIQGASGGVGSLATQIAKQMGARRIIGTSSSHRKAAFILAAGADVAVNYLDPDWTEQVSHATGGLGVDVILESIGGEIFEQNFQCLAPFGRYVLFGSTRGEGSPLRPRRLMAKSQSLTGFYLPQFLDRPELIQDGLRFLVDQTAKGALRPVVDSVLPLSKSAQAHQLLEEQRILGIVVLRIGD